MTRSQRAASFAPALAAQRAYLEQRGARSKLGLIVPEAFVRGIRDLGYKSNGDALAELIDNAIQAFAGRVDVVFGFEGRRSLKKPVQLAVVDNGHGMDPAMIRMAVMWGGTHREDDRSGLGRYGYGLPCASVSLGRRLTVYSTVDGERLFAVTIDLDRLIMGDYTDHTGEIIVPEAELATLPNFVANAVAVAYPEGWRSGTVILVENLDRLEWRTVQGLRENLCRQFGVTYHKMRGDAEIFVDALPVNAIDPLFLAPELGFFDLDRDRAFALEPVRIEAQDLTSGAYKGVVTLRYAWLPPSFGSVDKARDAVGMNANERFSIMKDYHGIIFSRNRRLIDIQTRTPWTTFTNNDRYIKVEVEFSATLDEAFGVTTSKQQVTVSRAAWDVLRQAGLPKAIEQLRAKVKDAKLARRARALSPPPGEQRLSERALSAHADCCSWKQGELDLPPWRYKTLLMHAPGEPFFKVDRDGSTCLLCINTAHRFFSDIYDAPAVTPEFRAALEVMLFTFSGSAVGSSPDGSGRTEDGLTSWSERLSHGLEMLAAHLLASAEEGAGGRLRTISASGCVPDRP